MGKDDIRARVTPPGLKFLKILEGLGKDAECSRETVETYPAMIMVPIHI